MYSEEMDELEEWVKANFTEDEFALAFAIFKRETALSDGFGYYGNSVKVVKLIIADYRKYSGLGIASE